MAVRWNRGFYLTHRWMGLVSGLLLMVIGLTGSAVAFRDELDAFQFRRMLRVAPTPEPISLDAAFSAALAARPGAHVFGSELPPGPGRAMTFIFMEAGRYGAMIVDPYRGRVVGEYDQGQSVATVLLFLHYTLLLSPWGEAAVAFAGIVLFAAGVTGVWIYRRSLWKPLRRGVRWREGMQRLSKDLHVLVGVAAVLFNLLMAFTGFWMMLYVFDPAHYRTEETPPPGPAVPMSLDALVVTARATFEDFAPTGVYLPFASGEPVMVTGNLPGTPFWLGGSSGHGRSQVELDAATGKVVKAVDIRSAGGREKFEVAVGELHFGQFGGLPIKVLYATLGLTPGLLSLTGFVLWLQRRRRTRAAAASPVGVTSWAAGAPPS